MGKIWKVIISANFQYHDRALLAEALRRNWMEMKENRIVSVCVNTGNELLTTLAGKLPFSYLVTIFLNCPAGIRWCELQELHQLDCGIQPQPDSILCCNSTGYTRVDSGNEWGAGLTKPTPLLGEGLVRALDEVFMCYCFETPSCVIVEAGLRSADLPLPATSEPCFMIMHLDENRGN